MSFLLTKIFFFPQKKSLRILSKVLVKVQQYNKNPVRDCINFQGNSINLPFYIMTTQQRQSINDSNF